MSEENEDITPRHWVWKLLPPFSALADYISLFVMWVIVIIYSLMNPLIEGWDVRILVWVFFALFLIIIHGVTEYDRAAYKTSLKCLAGNKGVYTIESFKILGPIPGMRHKEKGEPEGQARPPMVAFVVGGKDKPFHITGRMYFIVPMQLVYKLSDAIIFNVMLKPFDIERRQLDEDIVDALKSLEHKKFNARSPIFMGWTPMLDTEDLHRTAKELSYDPVAHEKRWKSIVSFWKDVVDTLTTRIAKLEGKTPEQVKKDIKTPGSLP